MFELDAFRGHEKVIDHYRWLRDSTTSDMERERFQRRMDEESAALNRFLAQQSSGAQNAA
jgi:protease II